MKHVKRVCLLALLAIGVAVPSARASAVPTNPGVATLLSDAELDSTLGSAAELCRLPGGDLCLGPGANGPIVRVILWDERIGGKGQAQAWGGGLYGLIQTSMRGTLEFNSGTGR